MMRRTAGLFCSLLALCAMGCVDNNTSFFISGNLAPDGSCLYSPDNDLIFSGTYDVSVGNAYILHPQYNNALQNRANHLMTDPNGVQVTEAEIEIALADGTTIDFSGAPNPLVVPTSTYVFSSGSEGDVEQGAGSLVAIPSNYAPTLLALVQGGTSGNVITVSVIVRGRTGGDNEIESASWSYNVTLCDGCLGQRCLLPGEEETIACNAGQDSLNLIDCGMNCGADADCDDMNECTAGSCDVISGVCSFSPVLDGTACTVGGTMCMSGVCI